jgi:hypothetical protein
MTLTLCDGIVASRQPDLRPQRLQRSALAFDDVLRDDDGGLGAGDRRRHGHANAVVPGGSRHQTSGQVLLGKAEDFVKRSPELE